MVLDHIGFNVKDMATSRAFYDSALAPLGISMMMSVGPEDTGGGSFVGYGADGKPFFWISDKPHTGNCVHVAFTAPDRAAVQAFHRAGLAAGGADNGGPGLRADYAPDYYAAFVLDPDGHNIEAVTRSAT